MEGLDDRNDTLRVTDDDLFAMIFDSHDERWSTLAREEPELARQIEQMATRVRQGLETKTITPLEAQSQLIDFGVFIVSAMKHALNVRRSEQPPMSSL